MAVNNIGVDKKELNESLDTKLAGFVPSGGTGLTAAESTKLNEIHTRQGVDTDTDTSLTLFGRLKQLYNYLTTHLSITRMARIDNLDAIKLKTDDILYPTKYFRGSFTGDVAQNVFVVVANVTSGKGFLSYVGVNYTSGGAIRVTIDGVVTIINFNSADIVDINTGSSPHSSVYGYNFNVYFNSSLMVEVTDTTTGTGIINAAAHYNLV